MSQNENLSNWLGCLPPGIAWEELWAIPGSHHSATSLYPPSFVKRHLWRFARTQNFDIAEQLRMGVRFFDLRVQMAVAVDGMWSTIEKGQKEPCIAHYFVNEARSLRRRRWLDGECEPFARRRLPTG